MNSKTPVVKKDLDLMEFAVRFLENQGAVIEADDTVLDVLLPRTLSNALDVADYFAITQKKDTTKVVKDRPLYEIELQSSLLDKILSIAESKPPFIGVDLKFTYVKTQGFANLVNDTFECYKSKIHIGQTARTHTRYLLLTCKFLAQSDEQKQGLIDFCINMDTGALVQGMLPLLPYVEKEYPGQTQGYSNEEIHKILKIVRFYGPDVLEREFSPFIESMNRRFKRDSQSLDEYYAALKNEMEVSLSRTGISEKLRLERNEKIDMIPLELAAKKKDLLKKYSIRTRFTPVAALAVRTPGVTIFAGLVSGRNKKKIGITYNPVTKQVDPLVCQSCGISTYTPGLCPGLHLICTACLEKGCTVCH